MGELLGRTNSTQCTPKDVKNLQQIMHTLASSKTAILAVKKKTTWTDKKIISDIHKRKKAEICSFMFQNEHIKIHHKKQTSIEAVGLQIWSGALLLADYISNYPSLFKDQIVMELGCGVGLTSIVASKLSKCVFATDLHNIVHLTQ